MQRFILYIFAIIMLTAPAGAAILVRSPSGQITTKATLAAASTAADCAGKTIIVTSPQTVTTAITWPTDRKLTFDNGGYITFSGVGALTGALSECKPEYFGVNTTPGVTDMLAALNSCVSALPSTGGKIILATGQTAISGPLVINKPIKLSGFGNYSSTGAASELVKLASATGNAITVTAANTTLSDFLLIGINGNTGDGIQVLAPNVSIRNLTVEGMAGNGIRIGKDTTGNNSNNWSLYDVESSDNGANGLYLHDYDSKASDGSAVNFKAVGNTSNGVYSNLAIANTFSGTHSSSNGGWGVLVSPSTATATYSTFNGGKFASNTSGQLKLDTNSSYNFVYIPILAPPAASMTTNGSMTSNITGWSGANWAWNSANSGEALHTAGATTALTGTDTYVIGRTYLVTYHVYYTSGVSVTMSFGGLTDTARTRSGTYTYTGTVTATTAMAFTPTSDYAGAVNLVSVQLLPYTDAGTHNIIITEPASATIASNAAALNTWTTPLFNAGDFSGNGTNTWTVGSSNVVNHQYSIVGKTCHYILEVASASVGGTPQGALWVLLPGGMSFAKGGYMGPLVYSDNGTYGIGVVNAANQYMILQKNIAASNWATSSSNTTIIVNLEFEIL